MSAIPFITEADGAGQLSWHELTDWLDRGHKGARASIKDVLIARDNGSLLSRAAWVDEYGIGVKSATIFPGNRNLERPLPSVHAVVTLFDSGSGAPLAIIDGQLVTKWKTAGDSVLGARYLVRPDSRSLLVVGAGVMAEAVIDAYSCTFPGLKQVCIWNRTRSNADALAERTSTEKLEVRSVPDLPGTAGEADIIVCATTATEPVLYGEWVAPGTHVDLIGACRPDMREADDALLQKSSIFVDARETTIHEIGELMIPLQSGAIQEGDVRGDLYDLCVGSVARQSSEEITLFKNGGGAHLDVLTATYIRSKLGDLVD